jgi:hypothetical protein
MKFHEASKPGSFPSQKKRLFIKSKPPIFEALWKFFAKIAFTLKPP